MLIRAKIEAYAQDPGAQTNNVNPLQGRDEIETDRKQGSVTTLRALAGALGVTLDDLTE